MSASDRMATPEQFKPPRELAADLSPVLESAVMQALALPLDSRFRDAQQMRVALVARRTSPSPPPTRRLRMPAGLLAVGAVVTLALCGVGAWGAANAVGPALARIGAARTAGSVAPAPTATSTAAAQDVVASPTAPPAATSTASGSLPPNAATAPTLTASTPVPTATAPTPSIASPTATHTPVPMVAYEPVTLDAVANATQGFAAPPTGELTLGGVPFRLTERIVQTQAEPATHSTFPTRVRLDLSIPGATHVHLLLTTGNGFRDFAGSAIGEVLAYCDGTAAHLSTLVLGRDIREWHSQPNVVRRHRALRRSGPDPLRGPRFRDGSIC